MSLSISTVRFSKNSWSWFDQLGNKSPNLGRTEGVTVNNPMSYFFGCENFVFPTCSCFSSGSEW
jgi:hypothetical protein